jgi:crossover junction endonuclease MUS81
MSAACPQNEPLALYLLQKRDELASKKDGCRKKLDATLAKAYRNICESKIPICSLRDAARVPGIGQWTLKLLKGFFPDATSQEEMDALDLHDAASTGNFDWKKRLQVSPFFFF